MMRNFLVEALMLLAESAGLERGRADVREHARPDRGPPRAERLRRRARDDLRARPAGRPPTSGAAGGSCRCGAGGSTCSRSATAWRHRPRSSSRATRRSRRSSAATSSSTRIRRPGRGRWPPCARSGPAAGPAHDRRAGPATGLPLARAPARARAFDDDRSARGERVDERPRVERGFRRMDARPARRARRGRRRSPPRCR